MLEILRPRGALTFEGAGLRLVGQEPRRRRFDPAATCHAPYDAAVADFIARSLDGGECETSPADNLQTVFLVEERDRLAGRQEAR